MTRTRGNVIIENIKIGDIHYEYEYGYVFKVRVISLPTKDNEGGYNWEAINIKTGTRIGYYVHPDYTHYGPNLYDYEAYQGFKEGFENVAL